MGQGLRKTPWMVVVWNGEAVLPGEHCALVHCEKDEGQTICRRMQNNGKYMMHFVILQSLHTSLGQGRQCELTGVSSKETFPYGD